MVSELQSLAAKADTIYLATDLDREGEAIAWHLREIIGGDDSRYKRVVFNEITKNAVQQALSQPDQINMDRVQAQTGVSSLRLLADLYHLTVNGDDVAAVIDTHLDRIGHVQIADVPGRGAPGTGRVDLVGHLRRLADGGYRGYVGLEYHAPDDPFGWLARNEIGLFDSGEPQ